MPDEEPLAFVVWPRKDDELTAFMRWLAHTHAMRWHVSHHTVGGGHLYQGRFKAFPVQSGRHLLQVCRYVEQNALRAGLVGRAEEWRWCSLWRRGQSAELSEMLLPPDRWPARPPRDRVRAVNRAEMGAELDALRQCVIRGRPFGGAAWTGLTVGRLGLGNTLRPRGRPRKPARTKTAA